MVTTPDRSVAARIRRLREHGMDISAADRQRSQQPILERYTEVGFNFRMTDVQPAIGLVQLRKLERLVLRRRELAKRYRCLLSFILRLPLFHDITQAQQDAVVSAVRASLVEEYPPASPVRHASAKGMPRDYTQDNSVRIGDVECPAP